MNEQTRMTHPRLEPELFESLRDSIREVIETMVFMSPETVESITHLVDQPHVVFAGEVVGMLGFTGTRSGSVVVCCSEHLCREIAARMLTIEPGELAGFEEAADAFGEVVNMITGSFKDSWVAKGNEMSLAVPTVTRHGAVSINHTDQGISCGIRVMLEGNPLDVTVLFAAGD